MQGAAKLSALSGGVDAGIARPTTTNSHARVSLRTHTTHRHLHSVQIHKRNTLELSSNLAQEADASTRKVAETVGKYQPLCQGLQLHCYTGVCVIVAVNAHFHKCLNLHLCCRVCVGIRSCRLTYTCRQGSCSCIGLT